MLTIGPNDLSVGIDIECIERFKRLDKKRTGSFLFKVFTRKEIDYCFSKKTFAKHLAVRFAAKEAVFKAIGLFCKRPPALNEIEISNDINGIPAVDLDGYGIKISLSHCENIAIASALVWKK